jgi:metal-responsive CopG/Arc/MetJ family transcriptional regulator
MEKSDKTEPTRFSATIEKQQMERLDAMTLKLRRKRSSVLNELVEKYLDKLA